MDKILGRLMESKWFIRIFALVIAILLYLSVSVDQRGSNYSAGSNNFSTTVEDVPVEAYYDQDNFVVTGLPETADVHLEGNSSIVQITKSLRDFTVYVDLTNAPIGIQKAELKVKNISDKLKVRIDPAVVTVNVQEKVTKEFSVEPEFNKNALEEGYTAEEPLVEPGKVSVTGGKDVIDQIAYVRAVVNADAPVNETFTRKADVLVLDKNMNKLDVIVEPNQVSVTVPVASPSKTVPVVIKQTGSPKEGIIIKSIEPSIREVILFGKKKVLDETPSIEIPIDVSNIERDTKINIPIKLREGITAASPETITVHISVEKEETKEISNIPIRYNGLAKGYGLSFVQPVGGETSLTVKGPAHVLKDLQADDFELFIDVNGLTEGRHEVDIQVEGPEDVKWELVLKTAIIQIAKT
ncbi:CdaR family protein [Caldibacillus debilis]|uniref:YbbR-like domain-containing protein n=1 Tax=Caldibacillus debilis TaxID=301148 RepID=A0A150MFD3_9BACI|nr:CdaR family protein [Caldibacillus debilis]KYD23118.1 hypothetical protein B4135_0647 [Caldibacillus debilis]MBO2483172.1 YbbR-like domain-containing protein [Bacillaceae bacterium]MBY6271453.1 YbbR-like domain-containing protein [Bacillaceae bacterium]